MDANTKIALGSKPTKPKPHCARNPILYVMIIWGGIRYRILSATTCQVLGRVSDAAVYQEKDP